MTIGTEQLPGAMMMRARERRPLRSIFRLAEQSERGDAESGGGDEIVILREVQLLLRSEVVVDQTCVTLERSADPLPIRLGQIVIKKIVGPSDAVEQMAGSQVGVRQVVRVTPRLVVDRREGP